MEFDDEVVFLFKLFVDKLCVKEIYIFEVVDEDEDKGFVWVDKCGKVMFFFLESIFKYFCVILELRGRKNIDCIE